MSVEQVIDAQSLGTILASGYAHGRAFYGFSLVMEPVATVAKLLRQRAIAAAEPVGITPSGNIVMPYLGFSPAAIEIPLDVSTGQLQLPRLHSHNFQLRVVVDALNRDTTPLATLLARPRDQFYQILARDAERRGKMAVWEKLASQSWLAKLFGPDSPFSYPYTPVVLTNIKMRSLESYCEITAECGPRYVVFNFYG